MAERRTLAAPVEARADEGGTRRIAGYGAVFNTITDIGGYFREQIAPGAFAKSIANGDIRSLFNHSSSQILGRTKSGTLRLREDDHGLHYEVDLPDTQVGRDLTVSMDRGDVDGSSFQFMATRQEWDETQDPPLRTILEAELYEVGPVTFPAYEDSDVHLRDGLSALEGARDERARAQHNATAAAARIAARRAKHEQIIRGIRPA